MNAPPILNPHLPGDPFYWEGGPVGILLTHGFTATTSEVRPLARFLHENGYTVAGPLLPGHFTHPAELNRTRWQDWVSSVEAMYDRLASQCETIVLGGESTGGLLSLYLAAEHPETAALLLYAPALRLTLSNWDILRLRLLAPFLPWITPQPGPKSIVDERWQGYPVRPLKGVLQLLALQQQIYPLLPNIHQPVLIVQGKLDTTVHPSVPEIIYQQVASGIKEQHWFERSAHCVILDQELDQVQELTLDFLHRCHLVISNQPSIIND